MRRADSGYTFGFVCPALRNSVTMPLPPRQSEPAESRTAGGGRCAGRSGRAGRGRRRQRVPAWPGRVPGERGGAAGPAVRVISCHTGSRCGTRSPGLGRRRKRGRSPSAQRTPVGAGSFGLAGHDSPVRVLLSDGSGLTSRQCATLLAREGHDVSVLAAAALPLTLTRWTRHVSRVHRLPPYGPDPLGWWDVAVRVLQRERPDVLLPTQEQVAVISRRQRDLDALGVGTVVPPFAALQRVQDKLAADQTLRAAGLRRPSSWVARDAAGWSGACAGRRSSRRPSAPPAPGCSACEVATRSGRRPRRFNRRVPSPPAGCSSRSRSPGPGPLLMVQSVFSAGRLLAASDPTE